MSSISSALRKQIEGQLQSEPLEIGDFRRIDGMGSHFMSLQAEHDGRPHLFSFDIEGTTIYIYKEIETPVSGG